MNLSSETIVALAGYILQLGIVLGVLRSNAESTKEQLKLMRADMDARFFEAREDNANLRKETKEEANAQRQRVHDLANQYHQMAMQVITTLAQIVAKQEVK